VNTLCL